MKTTPKLLRTIKELASGGTVSVGQMPKELALLLNDAGLLMVNTIGRNNHYKACTCEHFTETVESLLGLNDLEAQWKLLEKGNASRAEQVTATGDSKTQKARTFFGFLVNSYAPIAATLNGEAITIAPADGLYQFVADFEHFDIAPDVVVVGIENAENFRYIRRQRNFFDREMPWAKQILFVSRYPQNGDLARWLKRIPNQYVHFGDLDLAGINIFLTEFYAKTGTRSSFLVPSDYRERLPLGSTERYNAQIDRYPLHECSDTRVRPLIDAIHEFHKGYDQEGYIETEDRTVE